LLQPGKAGIVSKRIHFRVHVDGVKERRVLVDRALDLFEGLTALSERIAQDGHVQRICVVGFPAMLELVKDRMSIRGATELRQARAFERTLPRQITRHDRSELVLHERFRQAPGKLERLRVVRPADRQVRMELDGLAADDDRLVVLAAPHAHVHFSRRQRRQQRIDLVSLRDQLERSIELAERRAHERHADVHRRERRLLCERLREFFLGLLKAMLEHVQAVGTIAAQFRREPTLFDGAGMRVEKSRIHADGRVDAERRLHQVTGGQPFEGTEIAGALRRRLLKTLDGALCAFLGAAVGEVPALADELVRGRHFQAVPHLGAMDDPAAVFAEDLFHFPEGDVDRVTRDKRAVPRLRDHLVVANRASAVPEQDAKCLERLRPQAHLRVVAGQARARSVEAERTESEFHQRDRNEGIRPVYACSVKRGGVAI
jgi:hypothetical protein